MHACRALALCASIVVSLGAIGWPVLAQQPQATTTDRRPRFRTAIKLTTVNATVTDPDGRLIHDLSRDQIGRAHV